MLYTEVRTQNRYLQNIEIFKNAVYKMYSIIIFINILNIGIRNVFYFQPISLQHGKGLAMMH